MIPDKSNKELRSRKPLRLPFDTHRRLHWSQWVFAHRWGLIVTVSIYLLGMIGFLSYRIILNPLDSSSILVEFEKEPEPPKPEPTPEELRQIEIERLAEQEYERVANKVSNENSKLNASLKDDRRSSAKDIYKEVDRIAREMAAGKEAYERGLIEASKPTNTSKKSTDKSSETEPKERANVKGDVVVSYSLENRTDTYLYIPAYQCRGGGTVVVSITVNRNGRVTAATVDKASSSADDCMMEMAVKSAQASTFNVSASAPDRQRGTITYKFVPQR